MDQTKKKKGDILVGDKAYPTKPSFFDRVKESFEPTATRADVEAIRSRRAKLGT